MSRKDRKSKRAVKRSYGNNRNDNVVQGDFGDGVERFQPKKDNSPLRAKNEAQGHYILSIESKQLTFGIGPAGTGKTFIAGVMASDALTDNITEKIVITRPAVEAEESLGFLPGELDEKYEPYLRPFREVLDKRLGKSAVNYMIKSGKIEAAPMGFMRGRTFEDCWVILDEAQNVTPTQMKLFLTRIGNNCKVIVNGDPQQQDISGYSGLLDAIEKMEMSSYTGVAEFTEHDSVRSGLCKEVLRRYA